MRNEKVLLFKSEIEKRKIFRQDLQDEQDFEGERRESSIDCSIYSQFHWWR